MLSTACILLASVLAQDSAPDISRSRALEALNNEGIEHYRSERYSLAVEVFKKAHAIDPESEDVRENLSWAWVGIGLELLASGESARARRAFEESLAVDEIHYAHFGLGYADFQDLDDASARVHLESALRLDPDFAKACKILAQVEYRGGRSPRALELMRRAVDLDKEDREAASILTRWTEEARISKDFAELLSKHFTVRYDRSLPKSLVAIMVQQLEGAHRSLGDLLGVWPRRKLVVGLFTEEGFRKATGTYHWIGGLFDGQIKVPVRDRDHEAGPHREELFRALRHELVHALVKEIYPSCPNWLNEGVAQYFEVFTPPDAARPRDEAERRREARRRRTIEKLRQNRDRRVPFAQIPSQLWEASSESDARWTYLQGLGFAEYLGAAYGTFRVRMLLRAARQEGSVRRGFEVTYGKSLEKLEDDWWELVLKADER